jgi:L-idonate 5-dehydrogenase
VRRAPGLLGARVLVTGAGPIGALTCAAAKAAGAAEVVATDIAVGPLETAGAMGADRVVDVREADALDPYEADKGTFQVAFECSGSAPGLKDAVRCTMATGTVVQVGTGAPMEVAIGTIVAKEIALVGSFRFHEEFALAARLIDGGRVDVTPILTATLPLEKADAAFDLAGDRERAVKVQLDLTA